jgi:CRP-like cAMP-binding protein
LHSTFSHPIPSIPIGGLHRSSLEYGGKRKLFRAGSPLFLEGDSADSVFRVIRGRIHLATSRAMGPPSILRVATDGCFLGISAVLLGRAYEGSATAVKPTAVEVLSREQIRRLIDRVPAFAATAAVELSREYSEMIEHSKRLQLAGNTEERVARFLLGCVGDEEPGAPFELLYTHDEIGAMIGRSRESVTRTFTQFRHQGIIDMVDRMLKIRRPDSLHLLAGPIQELQPAGLLNAAVPAPALQRRRLLNRMTA